MPKKKKYRPKFKIGISGDLYSEYNEANEKRKYAGIKQRFSKADKANYNIDKRLRKMLIRKAKDNEV